MGSETLCKWLHELLARLPGVMYPFCLSSLPDRGVYFFYEKGEHWGHGGDEARIVRIGSTTSDDFPRRINEHFLIDDSSVRFDLNRGKPSDRSIFRKNIGRALLNKAHDPYLDVWEIDFITKKKRAEFSHLRDLAKERVIEAEVTRTLRENFSFRFISLDGKDWKQTDLEKLLIAARGGCSLCRPSANWLGLHSSKPRIRKSGMWQEQHLYSQPLREEQMRDVELLAAETLVRFS